MRTELMLAALGGLVVVGVPDLGLPSVPPAPRQGDFRWTGRLAAGQWLEVRGVNGPVRVEAAAGNEAEVIATKSARRSDPDDVEIVVVPHDEGVTICAVYPSRNGRENECLPGGGGRNNIHDNDVKVAFTVRLPNGVNVGAHTVNGDVTVRDVTGEVQAHTVNGDVDVSTRGVAEAHTVNGSIFASLGRADWTGTMSFHTVNGGITLEVPGDLAATLEARTVNGSIETDFPITVRGRFGSRTLRGTIGAGGRDLELETVNGSIRLRRTS